MRGRAAAGEQIGDYQVEGPGCGLLENGAGIPHPDPDPGRPCPARPASWLVQWQPPPDDVDERGVAVHRELPGPRPGRRHVPRQGEAAAAEMQNPERLPGGRHEVDQVPEPPHVLELEIARVVEVDMGLREAVHQQRPGRAAVRIAHELDHARARLVRHIDYRPSVSSAMSTCRKEEMNSSRLVTLQDVPALAELHRVNRDFLAPFEPARPDEYFTVAGQRAVITGALARYEQGSVLPHVILGASGEVTGRITLNEIVRGPFLSCSLGYWVSAAANGRGLATAAVRDMIGIAFTHLGLHRIQAGTLLHNTRSQRVLERNGFVRFGVAPQYLRIAGQWQDHALYQLIAGTGRACPQAGGTAPDGLAR